MTIDPDKLGDAIEDLHQTLNQTPLVDENSRSLLRELLVDIGRLLERPDLVTGSEGAKPATTAEIDESHHHRLENLAVGFEAEHPALAANLRQIVDALGKAGL